MNNENNNNIKATEGELPELTFLSDPRNNIFALSGILSDKNARKFKAHLNTNHNITLAEWRVINILMRYPDLTAVEITTNWGMDKMIINRSIKRLVDDGFLARKRDNSDRRSYKLTPTPKGQKLFMQVAPRSIELYRNYTGALTENEQKQLLGYIKKIISHVEGLPD